MSNMSGGGGGGGKGGGGGRRRLDEMDENDRLRIMGRDDPNLDQEDEIKLHDTTPVLQMVFFSVVAVAVVSWTLFVNMKYEPPDALERSIEVSVQTHVPYGSMRLPNLGHYKHDERYPPTQIIRKYPPTTPHRMAGATQLNVLCVGDSLTAGYRPGPDEPDTPYSARLAQRLDDWRSLGPEQGWILSQDARIRVDTVARSGECVTRVCVGPDSIPEMLSDALHEAYERGSPYHFVILLGGTNDLGRDVDWRPVQEALIEAAESVRDSLGHANTQTIVMSIPQTANDDKAPFLVKRRNKVNEQLKARAQRSAFVAGVPHAPSIEASDDGRLQDVGIIYANLNGKIPRKGLDTYVINKLWSDSLHFTELGYQEMGDVVYWAMHPFLMNDFFPPESTPDSDNQDGSIAT